MGSSNLLTHNFFSLFAVPLHTIVSYVEGHDQHNLHIRFCQEGLYKVSDCFCFWEILEAACGVRESALGQLTHHMMDLVGLSLVISSNDWRKTQASCGKSEIWSPNVFVSISMSCRWAWVLSNGVSFKLFLAQLSRDFHNHTPSYYSHSKKQGLF